MRIPAIFAAAALVAACTQGEEVPSPGAEKVAAGAVVPSEPEEEVWSPPPYVPGSGEARPVDASTLFRMVVRRVEAHANGEFETTAAFEARTVDADAMISPLSTRSIYLIPPENNFTRYNADEEEFQLFFGAPGCFLSNEYEDRSISCLLDFKLGGAYPDAGTDFKVLVDQSSTGKLIPDGESYFRLPTVGCPVPLHQAKVMEGRPVIAYGFRLTGADYWRGSKREDKQGRKINSLGIRMELTHVVCFDSSSGEVITEREV